MSGLMKDRLTAIAITITLLVLTAVLFKKATPEPVKENTSVSQIITVPMSAKNVDKKWKELIVKMSIIVYPIGPPHDTIDQFAGKAWYSYQAPLTKPMIFEDPPDINSEQLEREFPGRLSVEDGIVNLDLSTMANQLNDIELRISQSTDNSLHANWVDGQGNRLANSHLKAVGQDELEKLEDSNVTGPSVFLVSPHFFSGYDYPHLRVTVHRSSGNDVLDQIALKRLQRFVTTINFDEHFKDTYGWRKGKKTIMVVWKDVFNIKESSAKLPKAAKDYSEALKKDIFIGEEAWK